MRVNTAERIARRRAGIMPLEVFPKDMQERIAHAVAQPTPPGQWLALGPEGSFRPIAMIPSRAWFEWHWQRGIDPEAKREPLPAYLRDMVIDRDGYVCQLCNDLVRHDDVHIDHIKPYSKGGQHTLANLQVTHSRCNLKKGARD